MKKNSHYSIRFTLLPSQKIIALSVAINNDCITNIEYVPEINKVPLENYVSDSTLMTEFNRQLLAYSQEANFVFDLPTTFVGGTPLQQTILNALKDIPVGHTKTYKAFAEQLGTHPRVIGNACRKIHYRCFSLAIVSYPAKAWVDLPENEVGN